MSKWCIQPLYQRKEDKKDSLLNLEVHVYVHILYVYKLYIYSTCTNVHVPSMCTQLI